MESDFHKLLTISEKGRISLGEKSGSVRGRGNVECGIAAVLAAYLGTQFLP